MYSFSLLGPVIQSRISLTGLTYYRFVIQLWLLKNCLFRLAFNPGFTIDRLLDNKTQGTSLKRKAETGPKVVLILDDVIVLGAILLTFAQSI